MKLTVFGGTGPTGRQLIRLALADGHKITVVARNPDALANPPTGLTVRAGDVLVANSLVGTVDGADAVLSALGSTAGRVPTNVYSTGTGHIQDEMRAAGVRRLVVLTAAPVAPRAQRSWLERLIDRGLHLAFGEGYQDMVRLEQQLRASDLDWTVLRPPRLTDSPGTGKYRTAVDAPLPRCWSITRTDLARAMLDLLVDQSTIRTAVAVAN